MVRPHLLQDLSTNTLANFVKASTHVLHENFARFYFYQCSKGHHVHCAFINTQEKISPTEASGEIGENFILVKNTHHTVPINYPHLVRGCGLPPFPLFPHSPD